jgi:anti-anti-sigma regulatory factor
VIDLAATSFLDAAGLRVTARARKALPAGFPVVLRAPARQVRLALEFGGLAAV